LVRPTQHRSRYLSSPPLLLLLLPINTYRKRIRREWEREREREVSNMCAPSSQKAQPASLRARDGEREREREMGRVRPVCFFQVWSFLLLFAFTFIAAFHQQSFLRIVIRSRIRLVIWSSLTLGLSQSGNLGYVFLGQSWVQFLPVHLTMISTFIFRYVYIGEDCTVVCQQKCQ
jgi:hypothetical protein